MAELSRQRARQIQEEKLPLPDDRFHIAPEQIKEEHVPEQMPRAVVQKDGGKELPAVGGAQARYRSGPRYSRTKPGW